MLIAELNTLLTANIAPLQSGIALADSELTAFGRKVYVGPQVASPSLGVLAGEVAALKVELATLKAPNVVTVTANTGAAAAQLTALEAQLTAIRAAAAAPIIPNVGAAAGGGAAAGFSASALQNAGMRNIAGGAIASTVFTAPLVLGGAASIKFASDFQKSMLQVAALTDVGKSAVAGLSQEVLQLSTNPNIKAGPKALADALYYVSSTGLKGADAVKVLKASALGNAAGLGDAKVIANTLTSVRDAYGQDAGKAAHNVDVLTQAVKFGKGEANEYAGALAKVIPIASQAGVSFEEVAAQMASATRVGLKPSETATALRQIFNNLIDPSEKSKKAMKELGTSVEELRSKLRSEGLFSTLKDLSERSGGRIGPTVQLFGNIRALTGFLATTGEGTLKEYKRTLDAVMNADGSTLDAAKTSAQGFQFQLEKLASSAQKVAIEIGTRLIPSVTVFVQKVGVDLPASLRAWDNLPDGIKKVTLALGGLLALAGPLTSMVGLVQVLGGLGAKLAAFAGIGSAASLGSGAASTLAGGPVAWGLIAAAVVVAGAAYLGLRKSIADAATEEENLRKNAENTSRAFTDAMESAQNPAAKKAIGDLQTAVDGAGEKADKLDAALKKAVEARREIKELGLAPNAAAPLLSAIDKIIAGIENKKIHLGIETNPFLLSPDKREQSQNASGFYTDAEEALNAKARKYGLALPAKPNRLNVSQWDPQSNDDYQYEMDKFRTAVDDIKKRITEAEKDATHAAQKAYNASFQGRIENTLANFPNNQKKLIAVRDEFNKKYPNPELAPQKEADAIGHLTARIIQNTDVINRNAAVKKRVAGDAAADAAADQAAQSAETQKRLDDALQKSLGEQAQMWNAFGSQVEGVLGRIRQEEEQGGINGEKTAKARVEAELLKRAYDGIPEPLKQSLVQLAGIEFRMQRMLSMRDGFRELFNGIYSGLSAGGRQQFAQFAAQFEKSLDMSGAWANLQKQRNDLARPLIGTVEGKISDLKTAQEQVGVANSKAGGVYGSSSGAAPAFLQAMAQHSGEVIGLQCGQAITHYLRQNGGTKSATGLDTRANQVQPNADGTYPPGTIFRVKGAHYPSGHYMAVGADGQHWTEANYGIPKGVTTNRAINWQRDIAAAQWGGRSHIYGVPGAATGTGRELSSFPTDAQMRGSVQGVPAIQVRAPRKVNLPDTVPFDARVLTMQDLPKGWGGMMNDYRARPGEETGNRAAFERLVQQQAAAGNPWHGDYTKARAGMTAADMDATTQKVAAQARESIRSMGAQIRLAGRKDNPYSALADSFQYGENYFLNKYGQKALLDMTLGVMVENTRQATREMRRQISAEAGANRDAAPLISNTNFNSGAYDRKLFESQKRREIWNSSDITNLLQAGKAIEANRQSLIRLNLEMQKFDDARATGVALGRAGMFRDFTEESKQIARTAELLAQGSMSAADIARETEKSAYYAKQYADYIAHGVLPGTAGMMAGQDTKVWADNRAGRDTNDNSTAQTKYQQQRDSSLAIAKMQLENARKFGLGDPGLELQNQLDQKRQELTDFNNSPDTRADQKVDVEARVKAYRDELLVNQELARVNEGKQAALDAQNSALDAQSQREQALLYSATARLKVELQIEAQKRANAEARGIIETDEEKAARARADAERAATAAQSDRLDRLRSQAGDVKDSIRSLMSGDFASIGQKLRDQILDQGATSLTNRLFQNKAGGNILDPRGGGLIDMLGIGGFAGPLKGQGSTYDVLPNSSKSVGGTSSIAASVSAAVSHGFNAATVTINTPQTNVRSVTTNVAGGGNSPGIGSIVGFGGGPGSGPSGEQVMNTALTADGRIGATMA